ncbi:outer membrane protein assembly factor BamD [Mucilaginibacter sp. UR6-11]|uniref:outer membrane protein assembly factor BamD n=1 Tax=Mucilaginibacter sp. UR6-11 TaxID=1435644 RepID=UPI001E5FF90B|nr:outer membrane protein assembly factor BamD [Mucilaginibacter sp. UR6-11]MCC8426940.1 outer membrane protein assembly factor BamD [Mucilaginibacter sp. UR6-11]
MFKKQLPLFIGLLVVLTFAVIGCKSKYEKLKLSNDNAKKFQEGKRLYEKKEYAKALGLFETLLSRYRGTDGATDLFYLNAMANYKLKDYTSAAYHFNEFATSYPSDPRAEEARFLTAYCYYLDAPVFSLDQENTYKCIEKLQLFINLYPKSDRVAEASKLIQDLRDRLELKSYSNSKLYLTIGENQSAVIAFGNTLRDYPDTKYAEELEFLTIKAQYEYAHQSREYKQEERYNQAITFADQFLEKYPKSSYMAQAQKLKRDSQNGIDDVKRIIAAAREDEKLARRLAKKDSVFIQQRSENQDIHKKMP